MKNKTTKYNFKEKINYPIFSVVSLIAGKLDKPVYVIGGYVRDIILERTSKDIDFVIIGNGIELAEKIAAHLGKNVTVNIFKTFGTAMLKYDDWDIEFVGARKESYNENSRKPSVDNGSLEDDQNRRDFTINAMAISVNKDTFGQLLDPFNGLEDIKNKIIRTPLNPDITFSDDPLRMMRAIRFAAQLNFTIYHESLEAIKKNKERISIVSEERISDELNKIIASQIPSVGFQLLYETGLLSIILPQLANLKGVDTYQGKKHKDNFAHTLQVLDKIASQSDNIWLRWAALLHDIAKPITKKLDPSNGWTFHNHDFKGAKMIPIIFRQLRLPLNEKMDYVKKIVSLHHRPIFLSASDVTDSAIRRLLFDAGDDINDLMMLCEADITSKIPEKVKQYSANFQTVRVKLKEIEEKDRLRNWQPPISGELIMKTFNLSPCKEVGIIKTAIREAILDGEIGNNYQEAFEFMLKKGKKLGLVAV